MNREPKEPPRPAPSAVSGSSNATRERRAVGELFVLSAPSGTGKTTLVQRLTSGGSRVQSGLHFAISHTTRKPRAGEVNGVDYHFCEVDCFRQMVESNEFLEWAEVHGNLYGTSKLEVTERLLAGVDVLLDIDVQGMAAVVRRWRDERPVDTALHTIFVVPPSYAVLERRIRQRGLDDEREIARRLANSLGELTQARSYDYVIVNDDAAAASEALAAVILEKRHRRDRMAARLEAVLADFERSRQAARDRVEAGNPVDPRPAE